MPQIYVRPLKAYTEGKDGGQWVDAAQDAEDLQTDIDDILADSPVAGEEEWAVHDYEDMPNLGEYPSLEAVSVVGLAVDEHGSGLIEAASHVVDDIGNAEELRETLEERFQGIHDDEDEWAYSYLDNTGMLDELPEWAQAYSAALASEWGRSTIAGGEVAVVDLGPGKGVAVFSSY